MHIPLYCSFKLATCTAHSQHRQFPSPALRLVHLQFIFHTIFLQLDFNTSFSLFILSKMAAVTSVVSGSVAAAPLSATRLSSSATSAAAPAQFAPVRNVNLRGSRVVAVNATYSEENKSVTKQVLTSIVAAGVAISLAGSAFAAAGPGIDGAERTARKADELLQGADALIKNDSPQRFGPNRGLEAAKEDVDRFSQKAGSGAIPALQDASSAQVAGAREKVASNLQKTQRRVDGIWGQSARMANDLVASAQGKVDEVGKGAKKAFGQAAQGSVKNNVKSNVSNVAADVKGKVDEVTPGPAKGGFFGKIKQQGKAIQGAVASKGNELKNALPK